MVNGYFSSLLQQTGINIEPATDTKGSVAEEPRLATHARDAKAPLEIEETRLFEPQPVWMNEHRDAEDGEDRELQVKDASVSSSKLIETGEAKTLPKEWPSPAAKITEKIPKGVEPEKSQPKEVERDSGRPPLGLDTSENRKRSEDSIFRDVTVVVDDGEESRGGGTEASASPFGRPTFKRGGIKKDDMSVKEIPREQILNATLKEVRTWVAAQPGLTTAEKRTRAAEKVVGQVEEAMPGALDRAIKGKVVDGNAEKKRQAESGVLNYDLHLSIGPLNITIEEQEDTLRKKQSAASNADKPAREVMSSRLSRRYV